MIAVVHPMASYPDIFGLGEQCGSVMIHPLRLCVLAGLVLISITGVRSQTPVSSGYAYVSPRPGAFFVNPHTTLAFRSGGRIQRESLYGLTLSLRGSRSGDQRVPLRLARDGMTLVCAPGSPFQPGEAVTVSLPGGIRTSGGDRLPALTYGFTTTSLTAPIRKRPPQEGSGHPGGSALRASESLTSALPARTLHPLDVPEDFPPVRVLRNTSQGEDPLFLDNFSWGPEETAHYMMILYRDGTPAFYRKQDAWDFKRQPNGLLTYYDQITEEFYGLDSAYQVVDSFYCGNGLTTNEHEMQLLPDGRAYLMAYDAQMVAMDTVVEGGNPNAMVWGLIIQEIDRDKNVTFEWRSWDHFRITDATQENLTAAEVDVVHGNSIYVDTDSNIIISSRSMDEVTKISRATGEIIWRMGGKNNEFTLHDPVGWFDHQHAAYRLPNGNLILFDNGTYRGYSRAVEYAVDESTKVVTKVWEYNAGYNVLGWAMGNAQRLPNGNTLIGWGSANPIAAEVKPNGTVVHEMDMREFEYTYRVFSFPWQTTAFVPAHDTLHIGPIAPGDSAHAVLAISNPTAYDITLTAFRTRSVTFAVDTSDSIFLPAGGSFALPLRFRPSRRGTFTDTLEIRSEDTVQGIIRRVILRGEATLPTITASPAFSSLETSHSILQLSEPSRFLPHFRHPCGWTRFGPTPGVEPLAGSLARDRTGYVQVTIDPRLRGRCGIRWSSTATRRGCSCACLWMPRSCRPHRVQRSLPLRRSLHFGSIPRDSTARRTLMLTTTTAASVTVDSIRFASSMFSLNKRQFVVTTSDSLTISCTPRTRWRGPRHFALPWRFTADLAERADGCHISPTVTRVPSGFSLVWRSATGDSTFLPVVVYNASGTAARIDSAHVGTGIFGLFVLLPSTVVPYDSLRILVRFHPMAIAAYHDTLTVFTETGVSRIPVFGKGSDPLLGTVGDGGAVPSPIN